MANVRNYINNITTTTNNIARENAMHEFITSIGYEVHQIGDNVYEIVKSTTSYPSGNYLNPIIWEPNMQIIAGINENYSSDGWYVYNNLVQRCIKDGTPDNFNDTEYWEVI